MANRRFQGEDASEQIGQSSVHAGDMFQVRTQIGTIYDADKGMSFAELKGGFVATCTTAGATVAKVASIANYPDFQLKNGMEVLCYFANANAATSPTFNLDSTGAYPLALENQASGVNIGEGCWGAGVFLHLRYVDLTVSGTRIQKWIILGHNIASQNTSNSSGYTIYADGTSVYKPFFYKMGKEVTFEEIDRCFGLNRTYKGYKVECTCYNQGATSYASGVLINTTWNTYHSQYISISASSNKLIASTTVSGQENNVCWSIYPIEVVSM